MNSPLKNSDFMPQSTNLSQLKNIMNMINTSMNPQEALQQYIRQDPTMSKIVQLLQGKNPQEVFYTMCKQMNVNPEDVLKQLR